MHGWSTPVSIEPAPLGLELANSYGNIVRANSGRLYSMYGFNENNVTTLPSGKHITRTDMLGVYVFRYSDDEGATWSTARYPVPVPLTALDRNNTWHGKVRIGWSVDQAKVHNGVVYWAINKVGQYLISPPEEIFIVSSPNMMTEPDASKVTFEVLPHGDHGILPPGGNPTIFEEGHVLPLSAGMYLVGRTTQGFLGASYTADATGRTGWVSPAVAAQYLDTVLSASGSFAGSGRPVRNPRGPITPRRLSNGMYLMLYYNNGEKSYTNRDPYWLVAGVESGTHVFWSQPEIALYDSADHSDRPGYPDILEDASGNVYITETQKTESRVHQIDAALVAALLSQHNVSEVATGNLSLSLTSADAGTSVASPVWPEFPASPTAAMQGLAIGVRLSNHSAAQEGQVLLGTAGLTSSSAGIVLSVTADGGLEFRMQDGQKAANLTLDPTCSNALQTPGSHFVGLTADAGALILSFVVDGYACDGGGEIPYGWAWIAPMEAPGAAGDMLNVAPNYGGHFEEAHVYTRRLRISELLGNWRATSP